MTYIDDEFFGNTTGGILSDAEMSRLRERQSELRRSGVTKSLYAISHEEGLLDGDTLGLVADAATKLTINRIPRYDIQEKVGAGGMGTVYRAVQRSLKKTVAIKVLPPQLADNEQFVERFLREAKALAKLNHPNVVQVIDAGENDGIYFFVMEYVEGPTCASIVRSQGPLGEKRALNVIMQVVRALEHAAKNNLVHRDIKPDNIMITADGTAKLCDLGLVKSSSAESNLTVHGIAMGTPHYISPEQARGRVDIDLRSDIYSLGISLYYIMTGQLPFRGKSPGEVMRKHISEPFRFPKNLLAKISKGTAAVILKMAAKKRENRYQTPTELREDLELVMAGKPPGLADPVVPRDAVATEVVDEAGTETAGKKRLLLYSSIAGAAVVFAVIVILIAVLAGRKPNPGLPETLGGSGGNFTGEYEPGAKIRKPKKGTAASADRDLRRKLRQARELLEKARNLAGRDDLYLEEIISGLKELYASVPEDLLSDDDRAELDALIAGLEGEVVDDVARVDEKILETRGALTDRRYSKAIHIIASARAYARSREGAEKAGIAVQEMPIVIKNLYVAARTAAIRACRIGNFGGARAQLEPFRKTGIASLDEAAEKDYRAIGVSEKTSEQRREDVSAEEQIEKTAEAIAAELEKAAQEKYDEAKKLLESKKYLEAADAFNELLERYDDTKVVRGNRREIESTRPRRGLVRYITFKKRVLRVDEHPQTGITGNVALEGIGTDVGVTVCWEGYMLIDKTTRSKFFAYTEGKPYIKIGSITMKLYKASGQEDVHEMKKKHVRLSKSSFPRKVLIKVEFDDSDRKSVIFGRWDAEKEYPVPLDMTNCYYLPGQIPKVELKTK
ncbi:MAG: serine/threonine protein kinase [Planctomycetota bacterium]|jgi:serine/threonine-protein kinase